MWNENAAKRVASSETAPSQGREENRRIEVNRVFEEDGSSYVLLQDMSFGPGVGWYPQKTIRLDGEQVEALLKKLCCEHKSNKAQKEDLVRPENWTQTESRSTAQVINFPANKLD